MSQPPTFLPSLQQKCSKRIDDLAKVLHMTVLLVEQNAKKALEIGDNAYLLVSGRMVFEGSTKEILGHQELSRMYLGLKADVAAQDGA